MDPEPFSCRRRINLSISLNPVFILPARYAILVLRNGPGIRPYMEEKHDFF